MKLFDFFFKKNNASYAGFTFYWAWVTTVFYSDVLNLGFLHVESFIETIWLWTTWSHMMTLIFHSVVANRIPSVLKNPLFLYGGVVGMSLGILAILLSMILLGSSSSLLVPILLMSSVIIGITSAWHLLQWGETYACIPLSQVTGFSLTSFAAGLFAYFVLLLFPEEIVAVMVVLLPILSGVTIWRSQKSQVNERSEEASSSDTNTQSASLGSDSSKVRKVSAGLVLSIIAVFLFALCGEMLRVFSLSFTQAGITSMGSIYLLGGIIGLVFFGAYFVIPSHKKRRISLPLVRNVLILMALAIFAAPFLNELSVTTAYGIFGAGFWCFRVITWVVCFALIRYFSLSPLRTIGILDASFALSVVISGQLSAWLVQSILVGSTELISVALITVFVLMFMALFVLSRKEIALVLNQPTASSTIETDKTGQVQEDPIAASIARLAQEKKLTPREAEVADLLARGRSLPFIQEELYISAGTAHTHARHIYRKLGVHSRQEFLDLVEAGRAVRS